MANGSTGNSGVISDNKANSLFFITILMWLADWYFATRLQSTFVFENMYHGLYIGDLFTNILSFKWLLLALVSFFFVLSLGKMIARRLNKDYNFIQFITEKTLFYAILIITFLTLIVEGVEQGGLNYFGSLIHFGVAILIFNSYIRPFYGEDESGAYNTFLFIFIIDMFGRSIIPFIKSSELFSNQFFGFDAIFWGMNLLFIAPIWLIYLGYHIDTSTVRGRILNWIFLIIFILFFIGSAWQTIAQDLHVIKTTRFEEYRNLEKYCDDATLQEAEGLLRNDPDQLTEPHVINEKRTEPPYFETMDCIIPPWEIRLWSKYNYYRGKKGVTGASDLVGDQINLATGGYYEGEIDESETDEELGVFLEDVDYATPAFYKDRPSYVVTKIKGKARDDPIVVELSCGVYKKEKDGKYINVVQGQVGSSPDSIFHYQIVGREDKDFSCQVPNIPDGSTEIQFTADFEDKVLSSLKTYFMDTQTLDTYEEDQDPFSFFGITDTNPIARNTFGPFIIGMKTQDPPIGISLAERTITNPQLILGFTIDNKWEGEIKEIKEMELQLPKGIEPLFCSSYSFKPAQGTELSSQEGFQTYVLDKEATNKEFLDLLNDNQPPSNPINFFCNLQVNDPISLLGNTPISTKFIRLTINYQYRLKKSYPITISNLGRPTNLNSYFQTVFKRPDPGCTLIEDKAECDQKDFCYSEKDDENNFQSCEKCSDTARECTKLLTEEDCNKDPCRHLCYWNQKETEETSNCLPKHRELLSGYAITSDNEQFIWPSTSNIVKSCYAPSDDGFKYGLEIQIEDNTPIKAIEDGVVINVIKEPINAIEIEHFPGFKSRYHFLKEISVELHQYVTKGTILGTTGHEFENNEGKIFYFEIIDRQSGTGTSKVNPLIYNSNVKKGYFNPLSIRTLTESNSQILQFDKNSNCCRSDISTVYRMDHYLDNEGNQLCKTIE